MDKVGVEVQREQRRRRKKLAMDMDSKWQKPPRDANYSFKHCRMQYGRGKKGKLWRFMQELERRLQIRFAGYLEQAEALHAGIHAIRNRVISHVGEPHLLSDEAYATGNAAHSGQRFRILQIYSGQQRESLSSAFMAEEKEGVWLKEDPEAS
ncbi:unnamed protein product [Sphenostylis stenocarpa]|uniref:Uncharacterized protein n=1 Tax=Sphenostylis stenocarpa TaxID=92480 RepID=A0AA86W0W4_9FABA|nr:unnamed protein product [Sphenostylis stenocarpa]